MLQVNFIMIYIIHKTLVSLKVTRITVKIVFSNAFSRNIILSYLKKKKKIFTIYNDDSSRLAKDDNTIKDVRNLFRLKKGSRCHCN